MRDKRKYCRPKIQKYPKLGDVNIKLKCGEVVTVSPKTYKNIKDFFRMDSVVGEVSNSKGNIKVYDPEIDKEITINVSDYDKDRFELTEIIGSIPTTSAQDGDILVHNSILDEDAIFSYNDWVNLDDSWDLVGLYGITTYEEEDATDGDYVILANGHTLIIKPSDYPKVSSHWEQVDTIIIPTEEPGE